MSQDDPLAQRIENAISSLEEFAGPHTPPHRRARAAADGLRAALSALPPRDDLLREALSALEPFAKVADIADDGWTSGNYYADHVKIAPSVAVANFRRARAAADKIRAALTQEKQT